MSEICNFCGKAKSKPNPIISSNEQLTGVKAYICKACAFFIYQAFTDSALNTLESGSLEDVPSPKELKEHLDEYVVGQDQAKKVFSVAIYNHYKRLLHQKRMLKEVKDNLVNLTDLEENVELSKSNILLIGPTGSGKTLMAQTLARFLQNASLWLTIQHSLYGLPEVIHLY